MKISTHIIYITYKIFMNLELIHGATARNYDLKKG